MYRVFCLFFPSLCILLGIFYSQVKDIFLFHIHSFNSVLSYTYSRLCFSSLNSFKSPCVWKIPHGFCLTKGFPFYFLHSYISMCVFICNISSLISRYLVRGKEWYLLSLPSWVLVVLFITSSNRIILL